MATKRSTTSTNELLTEQDRQNLAAADERAMRSPSPRMTSTTPATVTGDDYTQQQPRSSTPFSLSGRTPTLFNKRVSRAPTVIPRSAAVTRQDLIASAEHIYYRYLSPAGNTVGATENHEIYLPPALRIHTFPLASSQDPKSDAEKSLLAQIPDMFHAQKEYCFRAMEQDAFPRFLRSKAFGNLTPLTALARLISGLIVLWIGLAVGFSLIFLDVQPKSKRFFVSPLLLILCMRSLMSIQLFIPFTIAILLLVSHQYELDPILVFLRQSESTPFRTLTIREPYVKKLLLGRAIWVTIVVAVLSTGLTLLFWGVPGYRL